MYIHSIKLINFKSFGNYPETEVIIEPNITAIIGKNESGKSNILDGMSQIKFLNKNPNAFVPEALNRSCREGQVNEYEVVLKTTEEEKSLGLKDPIIIKITKNSYEATGGILSYFSSNIQANIDKIIEILGPKSNNALQLSNPDLTYYYTYYDELLKTDVIDIPRRSDAFVFIQKRIGKINAELQSDLNRNINEAKEKWEFLTKTLPTIYYRKTDKHLKTTYRSDEIEKEFENPSSYPNSLLTDFVKLIGFSNEDFKMAARSGTAGPQEALRRKIVKAIDRKINEPFKEFYHNEIVKLYLTFNAGTITFTVETEDGEALLFSERSNGLRWYLESFIDTHANNVAHKNVVYLFDEPGTSLHVNAQKELLNMFQHLAAKGNQIIYTTHSPYMLDLDADGVHRIRAVVKDKDGFSYAYKTAYDSRIFPESQQDTLAPIINALGMSLDYTFGPAIGKINIVTEGMSDYIYLCTMAKLLGIDTSKYAIIPSVGASNCINICSILHGWGCKYVAVFDYDDAGVKTGGEYLRKDMMFEYGRQYCYLADVSQDEVDKGTYKDSPYRIEDTVTKDVINRFCKEKNISNKIGKPLMAKLLTNAIEFESFQISEECKENFRLLFKRIISCVQQH